MLIIQQYPIESNQALDITFNESGWFNATEVAKSFGKAVYEWMRLSETERYLKALESKYGKIPYLKTKRGKSGGDVASPKTSHTFCSMAKY